MKNETFLKVTGVILLIIIVVMVLSSILNGMIFSSIFGGGESGEGIFGSLLSNWQDITFAPIEKWTGMKWELVDNITDKVSEIPFDDIPFDDIPTPW